jgi:chaperonin GroES
MTSLRPTGDRVLIQLIPDSDVTPGGIIMPDSADKPLTRAKVIAIGNGRVLELGQRSDFSVKKGDVVLYVTRKGIPIRAENQDYILIDEDMIAVVVEP